MANKLMDEKKIVRLSKELGKSKSSKTSNIKPADSQKDTLPAVSIDDLPGIITEQFDMIKKLDSKVSSAIKKAETAKDSAATSHGKSAKRGVFHDYKREAIEANQEAISDVADAVGELAEAQTLQFEFQTKLTEITKYLFALGVTNIAMNRSVVRELELKLKGASKARLSELAQSEIISVVKQLKAQEDIMIKQDELTETVKEHQKKIASQDDIVKKQQELSKSISDYESRFIKKEEKDKEQDDKLEAMEIADKNQDKRISEQTKINKLQENEIQSLIEKVSSMEDKYNMLKKKAFLSLAAFIMAAISIIFSMISVIK